MQRSARRLAGQAAEISALVWKTRDPDIQRALENLAGRYREVAARCAVLESLAVDDPARAMLAASVEVLTKRLTGD